MDADRRWRKKQHTYAVRGGARTMSNVCAECSELIMPDECDDRGVCNRCLVQDVSDRRKLRFE
jgi:uncharacterized paraquat-inducible protein A